MSALSATRPDDAGWTFLTTHTLVLLCICQNPEIRLNEIAGQVGITERRVQTIVNDLVASGYLRRERRGRRNHYVVDGTLPLRHVETEHRKLGDLLSVL